MGLDGGTYITRSDVLRGQSWELATADNSRSTRGGNASTSSARTRNTVDVRTAKYVVSRLKTSSRFAPMFSVDVSHCRLTALSACEQEHPMVHMLFVQSAITSSYCSRLSRQSIQQVSLRADSMHSSVTACTQWYKAQAHAFKIQTNNLQVRNCREAVLEFLLSKGGAFVDDSAQVTLPKLFRAHDQLALLQIHI